MKGELERGVDTALAGRFDAGARRTGLRVGRRARASRPSCSCSPSARPAVRRCRPCSPRWPAWRSRSPSATRSSRQGSGSTCGASSRSPASSSSSSRPGWSPSPSTSSARPAWITNTGKAWDLGAILPESSPLGAMLAGLFGYRSTPTPLEVFGYLAYLIPVLTLFLLAGASQGGGDRRRGQAWSPSRSSSPRAVVRRPGRRSRPGASDASEAILVDASEFKFEPGVITAPSGSVTFRISNVGAVEHEFEIFEGETVVDEVEGLVPGLDSRPDGRPRARRVHLRLQARRPRRGRDDRDADHHRRRQLNGVPVANRPGAIDEDRRPAER